MAHRLNHERVNRAAKATGRHYSDFGPINRPTPTGIECGGCTLRSSEFPTRHAFLAHRANCSTIAVAA